MSPCGRTPAASSAAEIRDPKTETPVTRLDLAEPIGTTASAPPEQTKCARFRDLLTTPELGFVMEAHNGLSARIVEEAGFPAIWASGLAMSAALGIRDRNEASWTQVIEALEFMADATSIPILLDGDTGYGDFNNFRRLVRKLCQRDIAAVCIEDKTFPKSNSFVECQQRLANAAEFCGKIKAGKDTQLDDDFSIIARVEALIAGLGMDEALRRAEAYHAAGADGILIHSKQSTPDEIFRFADEWSNRAPLVIVPTMYHATPTERFRQANISLVIWANHNLRASITAMRDASRRIFQEQALGGVEGRVASLEDVFQIAGNSELAEAERRYLPAERQPRRAVVLAASRGRALAELTRDKPKCMLDVRGEPLLTRLVRTLGEAGVGDVTVVCGYKHEAIDVANVRKVVNDDFAATGEVASLSRALDALRENGLVCYGDIMIRGYILDLVLDCDADIAIAVDTRSDRSVERTTKHIPDFVLCNQPHSRDYTDDIPVLLDRIGHQVAEQDAHGEWIGVAKFNARGAKLLRAEIAAMEGDGSLARAGMPDLFNRLIAKGERPRVVYVMGDWLDVNDAFGLASARNFL